MLLEQERQQEMAKIGAPRPMAPVSSARGIMINVGGGLFVCFNLDVTFLSLQHSFLPVIGYFMTNLIF